MVLGDGTDADVVAFADDPLEAAVQVFHVRDGRVRGQRGWVVEKVEELTTGDLVQHFCPRSTAVSRARRVPREVLVPELPGDADALADWLSGRRGSRVDLRVPQRGDKRTLLETVGRNAKEALARHKLKRAGDLTTRGQALDEIAEALGLPEAPLRIECFDISQIQGTDVVASMVVFEDGLPRKSEYRRFIVRRGHRRPRRRCPRCCTRRFARYLDERAETGELGEETASDPDRAGIDPTTGRPRKFAYPPQLVVVDGGAPQVAAAARALAELGIDDVALCGLAKRLEEVWLPDDDVPGGSCRAPPRGSTCCSGSGTRRTGSPSPSTGSGGPSG